MVRHGSVREQGEGGRLSCPQEGEQAEDFRHGIREAVGLRPDRASSADPQRVDVLCLELWTDSDDDTESFADAEQARVTFFPIRPTSQDAVLVRQP